MTESFLARMAASEADVVVQAIVQYSSADSMQAFNDAARAAEAEVGIAMGPQFELIPAQPVTGTPQALLELEKQPFVERVWEDLPVSVLLDVSVPKVHAPHLWDMGFDGTGVKVAVIDTGIDPNHPDFGDRILESRDFTGTRPGGIDGHGHGTHVAGIIAGSGEASGGRYIGMAPQAQLLVAKVLRDNGSGMTSDVMAGVDWSVQQGAQVLNLSLGSGGPCNGSDALSVICDAAVDQGVVVCAAAGNSGPRARTVGSPGCARKVITIGATNDDDQITSFSSRGPTSDGRVKPDLCFPGFNIIAPRAHGTAMGAAVDPFYTSASGTSMATPHAAGAAAQLLEAMPGLTPDEIKQRLMETAINLGLDPNTQGTGRGDVRLAYEYAPTPPTPPEPPPTPVPTPPPTPEPPPVPVPPPPPPPGGCSPFAGGASAQSSGARAFWWILGILLVLCLCVACFASALIAVSVAAF